MGKEVLGKKWDSSEEETSPESILVLILCLFTG